MDLGGIAVYRYSENPLLLTLFLIFHRCSILHNYHTQTNDFAMADSTASSSFLSPPETSAETPSLGVLNSSWNQGAIRAYISVALSFPLTDSLSQNSAIAHIKSSLDSLSQQRPDFAGHLTTDEADRVYLHQRSGNKIPFEVVSHTESFPYSYGQLQGQEFTPRAFVHPDFVLDGSLSPPTLVPVCQVHLSIISGGLIMWLYLHLSFSDGDGLRMFIESFAAQTRGTQVHHPRNIANDPAQAHIDSQAQIESSSFNYLPTSVAVPGPRVRSGRTENQGHMFVFRNDRVQQLKDL